MAQFPHVASIARFNDPENVFFPNLGPVGLPWVVCFVLSTPLTRGTSLALARTSAVARGLSSGPRAQKAQRKRGWAQQRVNHWGEEQQCVDLLVS